MISIAWGKTPEENIAILREKGYKISFFYDEVSFQAHRRAFTVAKMMRMDLLHDMHKSLIKAQQDGAGFAEWKKRITPTLQAKGWWGERDIVNPKTGEVKTINIGSNRLRTIFETNMRMAKETARCREQMLLPSSIYWRYVSRLLPTTRETHSARHGVILTRDHIWWKKNRPLNGYGCKCTVTAHTKAQIKKRGWKISDETPGDIFDKGWDHSPCEGGEYTTEQQYFEKVQSLTCKKAFARTRTVLCPFEDIIKEHYKADMMHLLPKKEQWDQFVDESLDSSIKHHRSMRLGYLSMVVGLESFLSSKRPQSDLILADTGTIRNLRAKSQGSKKGKVLEVDEIKRLPEIIHKPLAAYDDGDLLLVYEVSGFGKIVVGVDAGGKRSIYHKIYSGQVYKHDKDLETAMRGKKKLF